MKEDIPPENKIALPLRHTASVKDAVDSIANKESIPPSILYRRIFNAGLNALYGMEIEGNKIIN